MKAAKHFNLSKNLGSFRYFVDILLHLYTNKLPIILQNAVAKLSFLIMTGPLSVHTSKQFILALTIPVLLELRYKSL